MGGRDREREIEREIEREKERERERKDGWEKENIEITKGMTVE